MVTAPLDLELLAEEAGEGSAPLPSDTALGHLHFHVGDLEAAGMFFEKGLGFDVTSRRFPGARFLSAGGYHHHVGLNTWAGDRRASPRATGLTGYALSLPPAGWDRLARHLREIRMPFLAKDEAITITDPCGHEFALAPSNGMS